MKISSAYSTIKARKKQGYGKVLARLVLYNKAHERRNLK